MFGVTRSLARFLVLVTCLSVCLLTTYDWLWRHMPVVSLEDVSAFWRSNEANIACLRAGSCNLSFSSFWVSTVFGATNCTQTNKYLWNPDAVTDVRRAALPEAVAASAPPLWLEALCLTLSLFTLAVYTVILCYIIWVRHVRLLCDALSLLFRALRHVDWNSPLHAMRASYKFGCYLYASFVHVWSVISLRERHVLICASGIFCAIASIRIGLGRRGLRCVIPLGLASSLYYCAAMFLKRSSQRQLTVFFGSHLPPLWLLSMLFRRYRLLFCPTLKIVEKPESSTGIAHEMGCLIDLFIISTLLQIFAMVPLIGSFLLRPFYIQHIMCFMSVLMVLHCAIAKWFNRDLVVSPLGRVKTLIVVSIDTAVNLAVGWPRILSSRISSQRRSGGFMQDYGTRIRSAISLLFPSATDRFAGFKGLASALRWLTLMPHLLVFLLPNILSRLYFSYLTLLSPIIRGLMLGNCCSFRSQTVVALNFVLAGAARWLASSFRISLLPIHTVLCLALPVCMDLVVRCVEGAG
ncbi:membrane protein, putative [Babesia bigemina]|uniref:Membrane protein, putative n=1 Tax=Babesia bigemina TaxID=5866 RepID=A0A061DDX1_BABBI|nr:membrane protein, putative [Babesia bigemina]CDR97759.1 membrane protein, putative [Babesia bigemina]|eukprot:XP_012769945.1 membrane protein, putative [Babesia bigemina]